MGGLTPCPSVCQSVCLWFFVCFRMSVCLSVCDCLSLSINVGVHVALSFSTCFFPNELDCVCMYVHVEVTGFTCITSFHKFLLPATSSAWPRWYKHGKCRILLAPCCMPGHTCCPWRQRHGQLPNGCGP